MEQESKQPMYVISLDSFGTLMTATLEWEGIPAYVIGIARGISAIVGIAATVVYPVVHPRLSTLRTGLWSIWTQVIWLHAILISEPLFKFFDCLIISLQAKDNMARHAMLEAWYDMV